MKAIERQKALEAVGWTFQIRNSQRRWVRYKGTSRRFARMLDYMEAQQARPKRERMCDGWPLCACVVRGTVKDCTTHLSYP